jgi:hypothetical protein
MEICLFGRVQEIMLVSHILDISLSFKKRLKRRRHDEKCERKVEQEVICRMNAGKHGTASGPN